MPYEIRKKDNEFCVYKQGTDEIKHCYTDRGAAVKLLRALYANVKDVDGGFVVVDPYSLEPITQLSDEQAARDVHDIYVTTGALVDRDFSNDERKAMAKAGTAMPDGSYPTPTKADWMNARQAIGRAKDKSKMGRVIAYLKRRAKSLGIPDSELPGAKD